MITLLIEPHHDDAVLFACYQMLRLHPVLVTVFGNAQAQERYGISADARDHENAEAMLLLQPSDWRTWNHSDIAPNGDAILGDMLRLNTVLHPKIVWAPMFEEGGHEQHNLVSEAAQMAYGNRCHFYATYRRGEGRTRTEIEVVPEEGWAEIKSAAMACYTTQIGLQNTNPWFTSDDALREWIQ